MIRTDLSFSGFDSPEDLKDEGAKVLEGDAARVVVVPVEVFVDLGAFLEVLGIVRLPVVLVGEVREDGTRLKQCEITIDNRGHGSSFFFFFFVGL